jgi:signal peptidase
VLTTLLVALAALAFLLMTVGPRVLHYRTATMLTGSMVPTISPGDVVVDTQEPAADIAVGQIITYHIPIDDHRVESHRVVWIGHDHDGTILMRTKGDANTAADPWTARIDTARVWRVRTVVPHAGSVIRRLRGPGLHLLLAVVAPALLIGWLLLSIWRPAGSGGEQDGDGEPAAGGVTEVQRAAVGGDDAGAGGEAEAGPGLVGAQAGERREHVGAAVGGNA